MTSIAVIVGSTREGSYNRALGELAAASLEAQGAGVTRIDLAAFDLPLYSAAIEADAFPPDAERLKALFAAQDGLLFEWAGQVHPRFRTPARAIVLQAVWSSALVWTGTYRALFTRVIYTEWIFFALLAVGVVMLRGRPGYAPAWRMPLVPIAPIVFTIVSAMIVVNAIRANLTDSAIGLGIVVSGIPAYYWWTRLRPR